MKFKTISTIAAILTLINAGFFFIVPGISLYLLGGSTDSTGLLMMRMAGACAISTGFITWSARNSISPETRRIVSMGNLVMFGLLIFVDTLGSVEHLFNAIRWPILVADSAILAGFASSIFMFRGHHP
jgi:hypothetical protein